MAKAKRRAVRQSGTSVRSKAPTRRRRNRKARLDLAAGLAGRIWSWLGTAKARAVRADPYLAPAFEALSRGARAAVLVESGKPAIAAIRENARALGVEDRITVVSARVERALEGQS